MKTFVIFKRNGKVTGSDYFSNDRTRIFFLQIIDRIANFVFRVAQRHVETGVDKEKIYVSSDCYLLFISYVRVKEEIMELWGTAPMRLIALFS